MLFFPSVPPRGGEGGDTDASRWVGGCRLAASTDARARGTDEEEEDDNDDDDAGISAAAPRTSWIAVGFGTLDGQEKGGQGSVEDGVWIRDGELVDARHSARLVLLLVEAHYRCLTSLQILTECCWVLCTRTR